MPSVVVDAETRWLSGLCTACKELGATAPVTSKEDYEGLLGAYVGIFRESGKPLIATECCRADADDLARAEAVRYQLGELKKRNIGFFAFALTYEDSNGNFSFMDAKDQLRRGHEAFDEY